MSETKNSLLGFLKDSGISPMICGRIEKLIDAFNGNIDQFVIATNAQIEATYNKAHPGSSKGLGVATYKALDVLRGRYRHANAQLRLAEKAEAETKASADEQACEEFRKNYLSKTIDLNVLKETCEWLQIMFSETDLGMLLEHYGKVLSRNKAPGGRNG